MRSQGGARVTRTPVTWHCTPFCRTRHRDPVAPDEVIEALAMRGGQQTGARRVTEPRQVGVFNRSLMQESRKASNSGSFPGLPTQ